MMDTVRRLSVGPPKMMCFGHELVNESRALPPFLDQAFARLDNDEDLITEGLFRKSGSRPLILKLKQRYEDGKPVNLINVSDPHIIAGLIKLYFREMPNPLFTFDSYQGFIDLWAKHQKAPDKAVSSLRPMLLKLPALHRVILKALVDFLLKLHAFEKVNMMATANIAIVFGPNVMRSKEETLQTILLDAAAVTGLFDLILRHHKVLLAGPDFEQRTGTVETLASTTAELMKDARDLDAAMPKTSAAAAKRQSANPFANFQSTSTTTTNRSAVSGGAGGKGKGKAPKGKGPKGGKKGKGGTAQLTRVNTALSLVDVENDPQSRINAPRRRPNHARSRSVDAVSNTALIPGAGVVAIPPAPRRKKGGAPPKGANNLDYSPPARAGKGLLESPGVAKKSKRKGGSKRKDGPPVAAPPTPVSPGNKGGNAATRALKNLFSPPKPDVVVVPATGLKTISTTVPKVPAAAGPSGISPPLPSSLPADKQKKKRGGSKRRGAGGKGGVVASNKTTSSGLGASDLHPAPPKTPASSSKSAARRPSKGKGGDPKSRPMPGTPGGAGGRRRTEGKGKSGLEGAYATNSTTASGTSGRKAAGGKGGKMPPPNARSRSKSPTKQPGGRGRSKGRSVSPAKKA